MIGLIELQQGLMHGTLAEKVQQGKEENLTVYQQYSAADMKEKQVRQQQAPHEAQTTDDVRIQRHKERRKRKGKKKKDVRKDTGQAAVHKSDNKIDIIA